MAPSVSATLIPAGPAASGPANVPFGLLEGYYLTVGQRRLYITHLRDDQAMPHSEEEWQAICAEQVKELMKRLEPNLQFRSIDLDLQMGTATYTPASGQNSLPLKIRSAAKRHFDTLSAAVAQSTGKPLAPAFGFKTIAGSYDQARTPLVQGPQGAQYTNACTSIDLEFAQHALLLTDRSQIDTPFIDQCLLRGQVKSAALRQHIAAEAAERGDGQVYIDIAFAEARLEHYPILTGGDLIVIPLTNARPATESFQRALLALNASTDQGRTVFGGFTGRGESFGVVIYRNSADISQIQEVVYFDSHSKPAQNGTPKACVKRFRTIDDAAAFLAHRNPYNQNAQGADQNQFSMMPFAIDTFVRAFFRLQDEYVTASQAERPEKLQQLRDVFFARVNSAHPALARAIAYFVSQRTTREDGQPSVADGLVKIHQNPALLLPTIGARLPAPFLTRETFYGFLTKGDSRKLKDMANQAMQAMPPG